MAKPDEQITLGIDVSKNRFEACHWETEGYSTFANEVAPIRAWLRAWRGRGVVRIALEPTSHYHRELVDEAQRLGFEIYLVNARALAHYRKSIGLRNKSDLADAYLLARYLAREREQLRLHRPSCERAQQLWQLLKRRARIVEAHQQLQQSLEDVAVPTRALHGAFERLLQQLDQRLEQLIDELGWRAHYRRCRSIPGIGPLNAAALVTAYHRGIFASADAFIAYLGLDVRIRESGRYQGKRKLTKQGEPELRRLLYCASHAARRYPPFAHYHQAQLDKGLSKTAANVILSRKLARIAYALLSTQQTFTPESSALAAAT